MKKWLILAVIALFLILGAGALAFTLMQSDSEEVFRDYLRKVAATEHSETDETFSGDGMNLTGKASVDTVEKKVMLLGDMECTANLEGTDIKLKSSLQQENATGYLRLNEISGEFSLANGTTVKLAEMYAQTIGVWYKVPDEQSLKSQIDSGVYVLSSGIVAPGYNTNTIVNALINKKALVLESVTEEGENKVIVYKSNKPAYLEVLNEVFPDLKNKDEILDNIFPAGDTETVTVTVNSNDELVSEKLTDENLCTDTLTALLGETPEGLSEETTGTVTHLPRGTVQITPITNSKPIDELSNDIVIPETSLPPEI